MNNKKITAKMISRMSKQSLKSSRMRNIFVMITIVLASALLTAILMFAMGQNQQIKNDLSHRQQVGYYNLTNEQVETLKADNRIAYQIQMKTGVLSPMDGFDVMPYYVSELSDKIQIGELLEGKLPEKKNEIAVQAEMLKKMDIEPTSIDYDPKAEISIAFFKKVQNKIHYAIHGQTAAEIIYTRADAEKEFMGLTTFKGNQPTLKEAVVAKNYLSEKNCVQWGSWCQDILILQNAKQSENR